MPITNEIFKVCVEIFLIKCASTSEHNELSSPVQVDFAQQGLEINDASMSEVNTVVRKILYEFDEKHPNSLLERKDKNSKKMFIAFRGKNKKAKREQFFDYLLGILKSVSKSADEKDVASNSSGLLAIPSAGKKRTHEEAFSNEALSHELFVLSSDDYELIKSSEEVFSNYVKEFRATIE